MGWGIGAHRWIIFKDGNHWTVARREKRSHIRGLPYFVMFHARTGADALAEFNYRMGGAKPAHAEIW